MNNEPPLTRGKRRFWIAFLIIGGSITATGLYFVLTAKPSHIPFDSEQWKEASVLKGAGIRQSMLLDLQRNVLHRGMTRDEVESLLGDDGLLIIPGDHDMAYFLGSAGSGVGSVSRTGSVSHFASRDQWLTLTFNELDQLVDWRIVSTR